MSHFCEKRRTDGQTDRLADRQTDNGDFIGPSLGRGTNNSPPASVIMTHFVRKSM